MLNVSPKLCFQLSVGIKLDYSSIKTCEEENGILKVHHFKSSNFIHNYSKMVDMCVFSRI